MHRRLRMVPPTAKGRVARAGEDLLALDQQGDAQIAAQRPQTDEEGAGRGVGMEPELEQRRHHQADEHRQDERGGAEIRVIGPLGAGAEPLRDVEARRHAEHRPHIGQGDAARQHDDGEDAVVLGRQGCGPARCSGRNGRRSAGSRRRASGRSGGSASRRCPSIVRPDPAAWVSGAEPAPAVPGGPDQRWRPRRRSPLRPRPR